MVIESEIFWDINQSKWDVRSPENTVIEPKFSRQTMEDEGDFIHHGGIGLRVILQESPIWKKGKSMVSG